MAAERSSAESSHCVEDYIHEDVRVCAESMQSLQVSETIGGGSAQVLRSVSADAAIGASQEEPLIVASFYKFADLPDYAEMREPIRQLCQKNLVTGGVILAPEGINGSLCGTKPALEALFSALRSDPRLASLQYREAPAGTEEAEMHSQPKGFRASSSPLAPGPDAPFRWDHVRVKLKKEVVTMGVEGVNPHELVGKYLAPREWNELISDPDTLVVDVRNSYEIRIGRFKGAVDPKTESFREFPTWVEQQLRGSGSAVERGEEEGESTAAMSERDGEGEEGAGERRNGSEKGHVSPKRVAMYCTGGIRCEKATSFMLAKGFKEVYHLEGGILRYLEEVPPSESLWEGECFVFDKRVAVGPTLAPGTHRLCYACRRPVAEREWREGPWEEGVGCVH